MGIDEIQRIQALPHSQPTAAFTAHAFTVGLQFAEGDATDPEQVGKWAQKYIG